MNSLNIELQSLIDAQEDPFVLIDRNYRVVAANQAYCNNYGISQDAILGQFCHEVSHHSPVPCHMNGEHCPHQEVFATGLPCQSLHVHFDQFNRPEHVRLKGHPIRSGDGKLYLGEMIFPIAPEAHVDCEEMRMIGRSPAFLACVDRLTSAAESEAPILLFGESGVGKELAAQYVHKRSQRHGKPFLAVDCASLPESLFESELFGHERGAFTGCIGRKQGLFEMADGGTLFLDEIGEIPLAMQAKLLRVLETGEFRRVGGREVLKADVRTVSATNRDLLEMADQGRFRPDLYFRISGIDVHLPPLRERRTDIPALAELILARIAGPNRPRYRLSEGALLRLMSYGYPGNVRELRNILQKAAALSDGMIREEHILLNRRAHPRPDHQTTPLTRASDAAPTAIEPRRRFAASISEMEAQHIANALLENNGNRRSAAIALGISERTLYRRLTHHGLN